jgi:hypothetical protein
VKLLADKAEVRAATARFRERLAALDTGPEARSRAHVETVLAQAVAAFAQALRWPGRLRTRLAPISFAAVRAFPRRVNERAARLEIHGTEAVLVLNSDAITLGNFGRLAGRTAALIHIFGRMRELAPQLTGAWACAPGDVCYSPAVAYCASHADACLVPDAFFHASGAYEEAAATLRAARIPWPQRKAQVFWRGSNTGILRYWPPRDDNDVRWLQRQELCERARLASRPGLFDVGLSRLDPRAEPGHADARQVDRLVAAPVPKEAFGGYAGVIDIDGNSNSWGGLFTSMLTGACVLKVGSEPRFRQWWYDRLEPGRNVVSVAADLEDLESVAAGVVADLERAQRIGSAGAALVEGMDWWTELDRAAERVAAWPGREP